MMNATVSAITPVGRDLRIVHLRTEKPFAYKAGQYVEIGFGGLPPRPYSIANAPGTTRLEFHVKKGPGPVSFYIMSQLQVGENVNLSSARGESVYNGDKTVPLLLIAGGLGFTPLKAIAEQTINGGHKAPVYFYWGTKEVSEQYMKGYFEDMAAEYERFHFVPIAEEPVGGRAAQDLENLEGFRIFVAGSPEMIAWTVKELEAKGARADSISYDRHPEA